MDNNPQEFPSTKEEYYKEISSLRILGRLEPYIKVEDKCPFCKQPKFKMQLISSPRYEGFYDLKCGYCLKTPRLEDEKIQHKIDMLNDKGD